LRRWIWIGIISVVLVSLVGGVVYFLGESQPRPKRESPMAPNVHEEEMHEHAEVPEPYAGRRNPLPGTEENLARGKEIYEANCATCHGADGRGNGPSARGLRLKPADFTDRRMMSEASDAYLFWRVSEGVPGTAMPAWKDQLTETQRWLVLRYIRDIFAPGTEHEANPHEH